ncbi:Alpha/beta hydrolase family-domain-containing protein [Xylogone sp. PMI_703]|nr:Alpha/beta hydrolase family-domain-containing protein [Xylogone sp. PMI_703]
MSSDLFDVTEHIVPCQHIREYPYATADSQEDVLHLAVKQYRPLDNPQPSPGDVTLIGSHANSMVKELYEPLWDDILRRSKQWGFRIRGIWIADVANQGASGELNEEKLGNDPSWSDNARDLLYMVNHFRSEMPRPLIGIGHSLGAGNITELSLLHPRLFMGVILLDPPFLRVPPLLEAKRSISRRDLWPSRSAAAAAVRANKFYAKWDERVIQLWIQYGFRELPTLLYPKSSTAGSGDKGVTLRTTKHQEVFNFVRPNFRGARENEERVIDRNTHAEQDLNQRGIFPFNQPEPIRVWNNLPAIRPPVLFIFGGESEVCSESIRRDCLTLTGSGVGGSGGIRDGRVSAVVLERIGHLVAMEAPDAVANAVVSWLGPEIQKWGKIEETVMKDWALKSKREKVTAGEELKRRLTEAFIVNEIQDVKGKI